MENIFFKKLLEKLIVLLFFYKMFLKIISNPMLSGHLLTFPFIYSFFGGGCSLGIQHKK